MYGNIKDGNDTNLKGEIGEIIAKYQLKKAFSTKQFYHSILNKFNLMEEHYQFLKDNWKSFDFVDPSSLTIYEIKTRKYFKGKLSGIKNKIVITPNFNKLCEEAHSLGFLVKVVDITLFDDWKYGIKIKDFNKEDFWVHRPRPSGWTRQLKSK